MTMRLRTTILGLLALASLTVGCAQEVAPLATSAIVPLGSVCTVTPTGLDCASTPPTTYTLTVSASGPGTVGASPTGPQPAGTAMTLTAIPTAGSGATFNGWSPAPCAPTFAMPTANLACLGTFATTPPPSGGTGTWTRLVQGQHSESATNPSPSNWYYNCLAVERVGKARVWGHWAAKTFLFDPTAGNTWKIVPGQIDWRENFGCTHDGTIFRLGPGAPVASGSNPQVWAGSVKYDPAIPLTQQPQLSWWRRLLGQQPRATSAGYALDPPNGGVAHGVYAHDAAGNRLLTWGGWSVNPPVSARQPDGSWTTLSNTPFPNVTQDAPRESLRRGGVHANGTAWFFVDNQELYLASPPSYTPTLVPTTGQKPPSNTVFAYHAGSNTYVGYVGCDDFGDPCTKSVGQTYLLDAPTKVWRLGPGKAASPPMTVMVRQQLLEDVVNTRVLWVGVDGATGGTSVWAWTPSGGTPPPAAKVSLTTASAGTGQGAVTGAGLYDPGAPVTLSASPFAGSTFQGWAPSPCAPSFPMPSSPLTCTATFVSTAPPPTGSCTPKTGQWVECITPTSANPFPNNPGGSKDINVTFDGERLIFGAGDIINSGIPDLFAFNIPVGSWDPISVGCRPNGQVMMNRPSDRGPMITDKNGDLWNWNGVPYPDAENQPCGTNGAIQKSGLLKRTKATGVWTLMKGPRGTGSLGGGAYDSAIDSMMHFEQGGPCSGNPGTLVRTKLSDLTQTSSPLCVGVTWSNGVGWVAFEQPERVFFAWDDVGRKLYVVAPRIRYDASGATERVAGLAVFDAATNVWSLKPNAPTGSLNIVPYFTKIVWDSVNKRVLYPVSDNPCGETYALLAFNPATDTWETLPTPPPAVHGSTAGFDPKANALVVGGSVFCSGYNQKAVYLYRYGP